MDDDWHAPTLTSAALTNTYRIHSHHDIVTDPDQFPAPLVELAQWSVDFLTKPNAELGRSGNVCPFARPSMEAGLYFFADTLTVPADAEDPAELMRAAKTWHEEAAGGLSSTLRPLLTLLVPMPWLGDAPSDEIDTTQQTLKDEYVRDGLMVGQFHPDSDEPGLWNDSFRPLRTRTPLLAIRFMTVGDIVFLTSTTSHLDAYLRRFAPEIPARARVALTALARPAAA